MSETDVRPQEENQPECPFECAEFINARSSIEQVRKFVTCAFDSLGIERHCRPEALAALLDDALLLASELTTNVNRYAKRCPFIEIVVKLIEGKLLRIEVPDNEKLSNVEVDPNVEPDLDRVSGRGLFIVKALSNDWGVEEMPDGKVTWCELMLDRVA